MCVVSSDDNSVLQHRPYISSPSLDHHFHNQNIRPSQAYDFPPWEQAAKSLQLPPIIRSLIVRVIVHVTVCVKVRVIHNVCAMADRVFPWLIEGSRVRMTR
jgi:hypothetical protein